MCCAAAWEFVMREWPNVFYDRSSCILTKWWVGIYSVAFPSTSWQSSGKCDSHHFSSHFHSIF